MKKLLQRRKGFTLIELLIVIVIIGILAVGFAPTLLNAPKKARDGVRKGQIASIQQAVEAYALDNAYLPSAAGTNCLPAGYSVNFQGSAAPVDPSGAKYANGTCVGGYQYILQDKATPKCYYIVATMEIPENNNGASVGAGDCALTTANPNTGYYTVVKY